MTYILEGLYLGDIDDAWNTDNLLKKGISHILTVEMRPLSIEAREKFCYKYVHALDLEDFDLLSQFDNCLTFIEQARRENDGDDQHHQNIQEKEQGANLNTDNIVSSITCDSKQNTDKELDKDSNQSQCVEVCSKDNISSTDALDDKVARSVGNSEDDNAIPLRRRCGVLVHCFAGQSRSAAVVLAYIMKSLYMTVDEGMELIRRHRPCVTPNNGFMSQLRLYEKMNCKLDMNINEYRVYRLRILSEQIFNSAHSADAILGNYLSPDPVNNVGSSALYKCKKCRRSLFRASSVISHKAGAGEANFKPVHTGQSTSKHRVTDQQCQASLFIEPVEWMSSDILCLSGKLNCPKCSSKLGAFNWSGDRCSCGEWITPAFHIQTSKVDHCNVITNVAVPSRRPVRTNIESQQQPMNAADTNSSKETITRPFSGCLLIKSKNVLKLNKYKQLLTNSLNAFRCFVLY